MSSTTTRTLDQLNRLRRDAVALRLDGATLAETSRRVGLSAPTITAALRAYRSGGWDAIDVAPRGRPRLLRQDDSSAGGSTPGDSRDMASRLRQDALQRPGHPPVCWTLDAVIAWFKREGVPASRSTVTSRLAEWDLTPPSRHRRLLDSASTDYTRFARRARRHGARILWLGSRRTANGETQLFAHEPRGRAWWVLLEQAPRSSDWLTFLLALDANSEEPVALVMPGMHLVRDPAIAAWLEKHDVEHVLVVDPGDGAANRRAPQTARKRPEDFAVNTARRHSAETTAETTADQATGTVADEADVSAASDGTTPRRPLTHLERLEAESIHIMREVVAEADNPVMLYSIGKDSAVMLHLARKAFFPAPPPFPLLHVDTTWKFQAMYAFRERIVDEYGLELIRHVNPDGLAQGVNPFTHGSALHTDIMKTEGLKQALDKHRFDIAFGGARRDEEKSRAKERVFSFRTPQHRWEPKDQRPELWSLYNARKRQGESIRVFPISNWTELDVWQYIHREDIPIVPLYFAAERPVVTRDGTLIMVDDDRMPLHDGEVPEMRKVRFRTLGCYPLTGAVPSEASTLEEVIQEMLLTKTSERQGRMIDHDSAASMEKKKQEGYF